MRVGDVFCCCDCDSSCLPTSDEKNPPQMKPAPDCGTGFQFHKDASEPKAFPQAVALRDVINSWTPFADHLAAK